MTTTTERVVPSTASPTDSTHQRGSRRWWGLVFIALAQLMVVLDMTIVNIALPHIQQDLALTAANRQWVITAYTLAFGGLLLLGGRVADLVGRKRTFLIGLIGFGAASALGGAATTAGLLFGARALQGAFAAMLAPSALSLMTTTFLDPKERSKAFGVYGAVAGGGSAIGLLAGGVLTEKLDWRWCMYVNVPIAVVAFLGGILLLRGYRSEHTDRRLDIPGVLLGCGGLLAIVYGFAEAENRGWSDHRVLALLVGGLTLLLLFAVVESRSKRPLLPPHVVANRNRAGAFLAVLLLVVGMFGMFLFLTYFFQINLRYTPIQAGLAFLPMTVAIIIASSQIAARLLPHVPARLLIVPGALLAAGGMLVLTQLSLTSGYVQVVLPGELMVGFGMGLVMMPAMSTATSGVAPRDAGVTSATVNTSQQVGGSIGTALLNTIAATATSTYLNTHPHTPLGIAAGTVHGYAVAIWWALGALVLAAVLAAVLINARPQRTQRVASASREPAPATESAGQHPALRGKVAGAGGVGVPAVLTLIDWSGQQAGQGTAGDDGSYQLHVPHPGQYVLIVSANSYQPKASSVTVGTSALDFDVALAGGARLNGTVRQAGTAVAVANALVTLVSVTGDVVASQPTGADGGYEFEGIAPGQYTLTVSHADYRPTAASTTIPSDGSVWHNVDLAANAEVSGTVLGPDGRPVHGASVTLVDAFGSAVEDAVTDSSGRYRFAGVRPGDYTLIAAGHAPVSSSVTLTSERRRQDIEFGIERNPVVHSGPTGRADGGAQAAVGPKASPR